MARPGNFALSLSLYRGALATDQKIGCVSIPDQVTVGVKCSGTVLLDPFRGASMRLGCLPCGNRT